MSLKGSVAFGEGVARWIERRVTRCAVGVCLHGAGEGCYASGFAAARADSAIRRHESSSPDSSPTEAWGMYPV